MRPAIDHEIAEPGSFRVFYMSPAMAIDLPPNSRRNSIGFLRLLLAAMVVYTHCFRLGGFRGEFLSEWSEGTVDAGLLAVQGFFVLSGALITASWLRTPTLGQFLWHRLVRLVPALWVCLAVTAFVFTPLLYLHTPEPKPSFFALDPSPWGYVWRNLILPRTQIAIDIYPNDAPWAGDWNGSLWTLFYEGACYLMIAALGLLGLLKRPRWLGGILIIGFVLLFTIWTATNAASLLWLPKQAGRLFDTPGKVLTVHFLAGSAWALFPELGSRFLGFRWAGPATCMLLVVGWCAGVHSLVSPWLLPPVLFWLAQALPFASFEQRLGGDYSYGLYVYGYPVQQILSHFRFHELGFGAYFSASLLAAGCCAVLSWRLVERPALSLKNIFVRRSLKPASA